MSASRDNNEDKMLLRLIAIEEAKIRAAADAPRLAADKIEAVKNRLFAEKDAILAEFDRESALQLQKKSGRGKVWAAVGVAAMLVLGAGVVTLWRGGQGVEAQIVTMQGSAKRGNEALTVGMKLQPGETIATNAKSSAVTHWGGVVWTMQGQNAKMVVGKVGKIDGRPAIELENQAGLVFVVAEKGKAEFSLRTPTVVMAVRGTSFSVSVTTEGTVLKVLEGTVEAAAAEKPGAPVRVEAKQKLAVMRGKSELRATALDDGEVAQLMRLSKIVALSRERAAEKDAGRTAALAKEIETLTNEMYAAAETQTANGAPQMTLADIRKKYGKVSKVNLKTGASYVGYFVLKGAQMEIVTPRGVIRVPTAQLKDVQDLN